MSFTLFAVCSSPIVAQFDALGRRFELATAPSVKESRRCAGLTTTFLCRLSWNLAASTSWSPQGLFRPVYCFTFYILILVNYWCFADRAPQYVYLSN